MPDTDPTQELRLQLEEVAGGTRMQLQDVAAFRLLELARVETRHIASARWFFDGFSRYLADAAELDQPVDLLSYWGLPSTPGRIKRALRNQWCARAAAQLAAPGLNPWPGCKALAAELASFMTLGVWHRSKHCAEPPAEIVSELRRCLWWACHYDDRARLGGKPLSARRLSEIHEVAAVFSREAAAVNRDA